MSKEKIEIKPVVPSRVHIRKQSLYKTTSGQDSKSCEKVVKGLNWGSEQCDISLEAGNPVRSLLQ